MSVPVPSRFRDRAEFGLTIDAAGEWLGISATAVEKDYWVSEVLRVMASEFVGDFILKGGTSLSKGYRLVRRVSEDSGGWWVGLTGLEPSCRRAR